jgi:predicted DNA-binding transcriptional regulator AlpA
MTELQEKELRNKRIIDMHNSGDNIKVIMKATGMSKSGIYKVIGSIVKVGETAPKEPVIEVELKGNEERFGSFVGWQRTNVNEYCNKETGEIVRVAFVRAKKEGKFGYFVRLANDAGVKSDEIEKKATASGNVDLQVKAAQ